LFLSELAGLKDALFLLGGTSTRAGIRDLIMFRKPRYLVIDEIDKIRGADDLSTLLSWMESGVVSIAQHKKYRVIKGMGWVFAAANRTDKIWSELMSRFWPVYLPIYTDEELEEVIVKVLTEREGLTRSLSCYIADKVIYDLRSKDPRDAIKIARLALTEEAVDWSIEFMKKYDRDSIGGYLSRRH